MSHEILSSIAGPDIQYVMRTFYEPRLNPTIFEFLRVRRQSYDKDGNFAINLSGVLHNNMRTDGMAPSSAFCTFIPGEGLIIEYVIGDWQLHNYLRYHTNYKDRLNHKGSELYSGHYEEHVRFSDSETFPVFIFDCIAGNEILNVSDSRYVAVTTLASEGIVPLSNDGTVVHVTRVIT